MELKESPWEGERNVASVSERPEDRRIHRRFEIPLWKYIKFHHQGQEHIGYVKNVSKGGIFVETKEVFDTQTLLEFEFYLPDSNLKVFGMAKVAWIRKDTGNALKPAGMGFEFLDFGGDSEKILREFIGDQD